jgi:hypothetical protein
MKTYSKCCGVMSNPNNGRGAFSKEMNDERDGIYVGDR